MTSVESVILAGDWEAIKKKRVTVKGMVTTVRNSLDKLLIRDGNGDFDHSQIQKVAVVSETEKLKSYHKSFVTLHEAYTEFRKPGDDDALETALLEEDQGYYEEVVHKIYQSEALYERYKESLEHHMASLPDLAGAKEGREQEENEDKSQEES